MDRKRHSSEQLSGVNKDSRVDVTDDNSWSTVVSGRRTSPATTSNSFSLLANANSYPDRTMRSNSITSRGSGRGRGRGPSLTRPESQAQQQDERDIPRDLGEDTRFVTPEPRGQFRDEITVECQKINDEPFRGTITFKEATETIFTQIMGFDLSDLYSLRMRYSGCPLIKFKLKQQINIDDLISVQNFNLERKAPNSVDTDFISCKIMGIRTTKSVPHYDGSENDVRWVKIEGSEYLLTEEQLKQGLQPFGTILTNIREDIYEDSDSERDLRVGNGTYSVKMKLERPIPQFLPMHGRKIRIYHAGITKLCTNCFGRHTRRQCRQQKTSWTTYVRDFMMEHPNLEEDYYGKWWEVIDQEFPGYFENQDQQPQQPQQPQQEPQQPEQNQARFADTAAPRPSRDPRIIQANARQTATAQRTKQDQPPNTQEATNLTTSYDRQTEMTRLLANGLTLTDARKYLDSKEEMAAIERRMPNTASGSHLPTPRTQSTSQTSSSFRGRRQNQSQQ